MLSVHLSGGMAMVRAAVDAGKETMILGVTVLTRIDQQTLREIGISDSVDEQVLRLARLGVEAGVGGLVASPHEVKRLREQIGAGIKLIVPGVRPSGSEADDQKRVMTPRQTLDAGADYLVIGRPITAHPHPREAAARILDEIAR